MIGDRRPSLSVVVAATDSAPAVDRLLGSMGGRAPGRVEVIVVGEARVVNHAGRARTIVAPAGSGVPRLRRLGLEASTAPLVVFTEDSCLADPGWLDAWLSTSEDPSILAASGLVEHDPGASALDWAVVFCEYAPFLPPGRPGPPARLAGNHFAVDRETALRLSGEEVHETSLLAAILGEGGQVRTVDRAVVRHVRRFGWREAFGDRFRFGLEFGRLRAGGLSPIARQAGWVAGPAIFSVQVGRLGWTVLRNRRYLGPFVRALPITLAMLGAWSLGEWAGWCLGPIGTWNHEPIVALRPTSPSERGPE